jgi:hypothetical protein
MRGAVRRSPLKPSQGKLTRFALANDRIERSLRTACWSCPQCASTGSPQSSLGLPSCAWSICPCRARPGTQSSLSLTPTPAGAPLHTFQLPGPTPKAAALGPLGLVQGLRYLFTQACRAHMLPVQAAQQPPVARAHHRHPSANGDDAPAAAARSSTAAAQLPATTSAPVDGDTKAASDRAVVAAGLTRHQVIRAIGYIGGTAAAQVREPVIAETPLHPPYTQNHVPYTSFLSRPCKTTTAEKRQLASAVECCCR